jgi:3-oxoacyl-[acyl-carrier-protein] synthase II
MPQPNSSENSPTATERSPRDVVITGIGVVSPIGIGREPFWSSLVEKRSGVGPLTAFDDRPQPCKFAAEVRDFEPKQYVRPRKSLKVMSRDIQLGFAAADLAIADSGVQPDQGDPERKGVIYGADFLYFEVESVLEAYQDCIVDGNFDFDRWGEHALARMYPLWLLKYLPNMPACHIGIAHDCRGPNNTIVLDEVSSLQALSEAASVIERGMADFIVAGGASCSINPTCYEFRGRGRFTRLNGDPATVCRPFDAKREGMLHGEGAAAFTLESRESAEARGANIVAQILGSASTFEPAKDDLAPTGSAIRRCIEMALDSAGLRAADIGHVNAHGLSTVEADRIEAQAIRDVLGDVPVTAPKSFFGNLRAAGGAVEAVASLFGLLEGEIPVTLNYEFPDPECPINVVHDRPLPVNQPTALLLSQGEHGQSVAVVIGRAD